MLKWRRVFLNVISPPLAYSVEKLVSSGILINFSQPAKSNSLFLLDVNLTKMPKFPQNGVF